MQIFSRAALNDDPAQNATSGFSLRRWWRWGGLAAFAIVSTSAVAGLSFDGRNRFVMQGARLGITIVNESNTSALAQVSVDWGEPGRADPLPIAMSKPLVKIAPKGKATVDVFYQGSGLPDDRESFLLLNVLDIPQVPRESNVLQIALRHRLKLFYRPKLKETPEEARATLAWERSASGDEIEVHNPSPYYVTLSDMEMLGSAGRPCGEPVEHLMVAPFSSQRVKTTECQLALLRYSVVSDAGNPLPYEATPISGEKRYGHPENR